jgi:hypothetical protein
MRTLIASDIFVRFIFGRQDWKLNFENIMVKLSQACHPR